MKQLIKLIDGKTVLCLAIFLSILIPVSGFSQEEKDVLKVEHSFARVVSTEASRNNIIVDLTSLPGFFERAYLLDLIFADSRMVIHETNISGSNLELYSDKLNDISQVLIALNSFRDKAINAGKSFNENQKKELMEKYEKYR
jgi:hypothetical protein